MAFNKCKQWNGEFNDIFGIDIEYVKSNEFDKLIDIITIWEVIRLISKSDFNIEDSFEFLSSCKVVNGHIGREFDECVEKGVAKANVLFSELIHISSILKQYYIPSIKCNTAVPSNDGNSSRENEVNRIVKNPRLFKINRPVKNDASRTTISTSNSTKSSRPDADNTCVIKFCNTYRYANFKNNGLGKDYIFNANLKYIKRSIPFVIIKNYIILHLINEGSVGKVYLAIDYKKNLYAVKMITKGGDYHSFNKIKDELLIASRLKHENIVETYLIMETRCKLLLFMEYCSGGDLITYIRINGTINEQVVRKAFRMLLESVKYLHRLDIYHRDIKPENIFLKPLLSRAAAAEAGTSKNLSNYAFKLGDFGASIRTKKEVKLFETVGTMSYAAPEVLDGVSGYTGEKADIWSLGVVLFAMLYGQLPYVAQEDNVKAILNQILNSKLVFPRTKTSTAAKKLISAMLEVNSQKRINLKQVYEHEWFTGKKYEVNEVKYVMSNRKESMVDEMDSALNLIVDEII